MGAGVRFFAVVGPRGRNGATSWSDAAYRYLLSMSGRGYGVRAVSIGFGYLQVPPNDPEWGHWNAVRELFRSQLDPDFINIVCAPPQFALGRKRTRKEMAPRRVVAGDGLPMVDPRMTRAAGDPDEVVYEPSTALQTLHTDRHLNFAITGCTPSMPTAEEAAALSRYTTTICPHEADVDPLRQLGVPAVFADPPTFARTLEEYLHGNRQAQRAHENR